MDAVWIFHQDGFQKIDIHGAIEAAETAIIAAFRIAPYLEPIDSKEFTQHHKEIHKAGVGTQKSAPQSIDE